jgi:hypothetical protein
MKNLALIFSITFFSSSSFAQADTLIRQLDSLAKGTDTIKSHNDIDPTAYNFNTKIDAKTYFILLASDLKQSFTKPFHMKKRDWKYLGGAALIIGGLSLLDQPVQQYALELRERSGSVRGISGQVTRFGGPYETYTLLAFGAYGFIFRNEKMKTATLLASQAYILGGAFERTIKFLSGRTRPSAYPPGTEARPQFKGPFAYMDAAYGGKRVSSSFPSGHTTVVFAAATVFAMEYRDRPWIPVVSYGAATLVGLSRITENAHWLSDVFAGAALGYLLGRQVVNNYHRYVKLKDQQKERISFTIQSQFGWPALGIVYKL